VPGSERQGTVLNILQDLKDLDGLKKLFWQELNYERENRPLSPRQWPESARQPLAEDPILFATGGEDNAFHIVYCRLESDALLRGHERPIVNRLTREHPFALFVFSNKGRTDWRFLNVKYDKEADKSRLLRRITVRPGVGLRTAAERMHMLDLETISPDLFALSPLSIQQRHDDAFDVEKVTKDFYREIANWYFWALKHAKFPKDAPKEQDGRDHISVIRLITRLIFCWFIREKGLIPDVIFDEKRLVEMLNGFDPKGGTDIPVCAKGKEQAGMPVSPSSVYYRAILQNLFFATLNTEMDQRAWARKDQHFMAHSLYRYKECFRDPKAGLEWFKDIPFLNGGLFECLDRDKGEGAEDRYVRVDGFSRRDDSRPTVPDFLFFGSEQDVDLSDDYGDKKFRSVRVRGLIDTLNRYKFTIEENTPFDQEVALDPELCGKVFENLLAAYNPETGTTARKATGSFYTPREIVDYMVDESLVAYLKGKLEGDTGILAGDSQTGMTVSPSSDTTITRRNLPHWTRDGAIYWITFRLADSLPKDKLRAWSEERDLWKAAHPEPWSEIEWKEYDERFGKRLDAWLDAGHGSRALAIPEVRETVRACLMKFDGQRLNVHAAVIMPTHVHALLEPIGANTRSELLKGIKGASARQVNKLLGTSGTFWMDESYDHIVRSEKQYRHFLRYIEENPSKAKLKEVEYWLHTKSGTDIPVCANGVETAIARQESQKSQAGMPVSLSSVESRIRALLAYDGDKPEFTEAETETLIEAIDGLKALDPAVGSGAFPMGILHKLVLVLGKLDPDNERWKAKQIAKLDDAAMREDAERLFRENYDDYGRKLYLIENCIYGVDIQPIAVQIAKMRFFISLIVDQKVESNTGLPACEEKAQTGMSVLPNLGVRALPNLETKFVAANTLIGIDRPSQMTFRNPEIDKKEAELRKVREKHFTARTLKSKAKCRADDKRLRAEIAELLKNDGWHNTTAKQLAAWDPYDQNPHAEFFDPEWMFGVTAGFDVVIGNPPYGLTLSKEEKLLFSARFKHQDYQIDSYLLFLEHAFDLLTDGGVVAFIIPNPWLTNLKLKKIRRFVLGQQVVRRIVHYSRKVFDATVDTQVVVIEKAKPTDNIVIVSIVKTKDSAAHHAVNQQEWVCLDGEPVNIFVRPQEAAVVRKMQTGTVQLKDLCAVTVGMKPYQVGKGIPKQSRSTVKERPFDATYRVDSTYRPLLRGRDIEKYATKWDGTRWIKYGGHLAEPRLSAGFDAPEKVVVRQTGDSLVATLDSERFVCMNNMHTITQKDPSCNLRFILALLNSRLLNFFFQWLNPESGEALAEVKKEHIEKLVVRRNTKGEDQAMVSLVDRILAAKAADPAADTSAWEREIDERVYKLYGLTAEEIRIVEGAARGKGGGK